MLAQCAEIKMIVAILAALHDETVAVPRQEHDRMEWLYIFLIGLAIELASLLAGFCIIGSKAAVVLVAVDLEHIDGLAVGAPCYVGEVTVGRVASLQIDGLSCKTVEHTHGDLMRGLASHRIFVGSGSSDATLCLGMIEAYLRYVDLRIIGHHALVHAIESQSFTIGTPEGAFRYAELIAVNALPVHDLAASISRELEIVRFLLLGHCVLGCRIEGTYIQVAAFQVSEGVLLSVGFEEIFALLKLQLADQTVLPEVDGIGLAAVAYHNDALASKGESGIVKSPYLYVLGRSNPLVDVVDAEEFSFLAIGFVYQIACIYILTYKLVAPPGAPAVLCHHVAIIVAAEVQVFECKCLIALLCRNYALCLCVDCRYSHYSNQ